MAKLTRKKKRIHFELTGAKISLKLKLDLLEKAFLERERDWSIKRGGMCEVTIILKLLKLQLEFYVWTGGEKSLKPDLPPPPHTHTHQV